MLSQGALLKCSQCDCYLVAIWSHDARCPRCNRFPGSNEACPVCGAALFEQRAKRLCSRCRTVYETCCEGGRTC